MKKNGETDKNVGGNSRIDNNTKITGIIYSVKNKATGEFYIGATGKSLIDRKRDHLNKSKNRKGGVFQEAIATYGANSFEWTQIDTANDSNELAEKEKKYIIEYKSLDDGYNRDSGGGFNKIVYQYDIENGSLLNKFNCLEDAGKSINSSKKSISSACLNVNHTYRGYYWSYFYTEPFKPNKDKRLKEVNQYDLNGNYMATFKSVSYASKITGISKTGIAKTCRGERFQSGNFKWKYV